MPLCFASCLVFLTSLPLRATSYHLSFFLPHFMPLYTTSLSILSTSLHATSCHFTLPPVLSASLHATSLYFTSPPFFLPHFVSPHLISSHLSTHPANFTKDSDIRKIQLWRIFEIIFTFAKDSDIRKIRIGESFEYLSHLQKIRTFKRFDSKFFPNLSNVLNILLTSLFLPKIQIFERFNSGESLK